MDRIWRAGAVDERSTPPVESHAANPVPAITRMAAAHRHADHEGARDGDIAAEMRFSSRKTSDALCHRASTFFARQRRTKIIERRRR